MSKKNYERFAEAIADTNSIEALQAALRFAADGEACDLWNITTPEYYKAVRLAISIKKSRVIK